jgi:hypothetical protein
MRVSHPKRKPNNIPPLLYVTISFASPSILIPEP